MSRIAFLAFLLCAPAAAHAMHVSHELVPVAYSPDGAHLVVAVIRADPEGRNLDVPDPQPVRVLDARTLEPVADYTAWSIRTEVDPEAGVLFHAGPLELEQVPLDAAFRWRLWAEGYAPAAGDERAFSIEEEGRFLAEVRLERGFGRRFVLLGRDPAMRPLKGARLFLDGAPAGETDAEGALEVVLPAPPSAFSARWGALTAAGKVPSDAAAALRAMTTVIVLEPPADR
jgi:hypothetical protein